MSMRSKVNEYHDGFKKVLMGINEILIIYDVFSVSFQFPNTDDVESECQSFLDEYSLLESEWSEQIEIKRKIVWVSKWVS